MTEGEHQEKVCKSCWDDGLESKRQEAELKVQRSALGVSKMGQISASKKQLRLTAWRQREPQMVWTCAGEVLDKRY